MARANREHSTLSDARHAHLVQSRQAPTSAQGAGARDFTTRLWRLSRACILRRPRTRSSAARSWVLWLAGVCDWHGSCAGRPLNMKKPGASLTSVMREAPGHSAEDEGFEPSRGLPPNRISSAAP